MRQTVLRVDALFLALAGVFGLVSDLLSYASGSGPFARTFYQDPKVIGVVEAHALAVLSAGTLWYFAQRTVTTPGHWLGLGAHAIMGISNIIWFEVFIRVQGETQGVVVTIVHFVFVAANAWLIATTRTAERARHTLPR